MYIFPWNSAVGIFTKVCRWNGNLLVVKNGQKKKDCLHEDLPTLTL